MNNYNLHHYVLFSLYRSRYFSVWRPLEDKLISMDPNFSKEEISQIKEMIEDALQYGYIEDEKSILLMYLRTEF